MDEDSNRIDETAPEYSRKPPQQKSNWESTRKKENRYRPKSLPNIKIPCNHYSKSYHCVSLRKNDIIKFHNNFYKSTSKIDQDNFILMHVDVSTVNRRRPKTGVGNKKNMSVVYMARRRNSRIPVCKKTFLSILGLKPNRVTNVIHRYFKSGGVPAKENRGGNRKARAFSPIIESIKDFIKKFKPIEVHYCRSKTKARQYLQSHLSISKIYKMYIAQCADEFKKVKSTYFRKIFRTCFNIGFGRPQTDVCSTCLTLSEQIKNEKCAFKKVELMTQKRVHKLRAKAFYKLLKEKRDDLLIFSFDCQKNQPTPKLPDQIVYYSRQLYVYNFAIVVGDSKSTLNADNVFIYTWNEDFLPKASNEIASAVFHCLNNEIEKHPTVTTIRLVADGCSGQNKNSTLLGMISKYLMDYAPTRIQKIEIVFPVVGHSFLPADRVFAQIEKEVKKIEIIENPQGYYDIFQRYGTVLKLGEDVDVFDWKGASTLVLKTTNSLHFSIKKCKRFFSKKNKTKSNAVVRGEETYNNSQNKYQPITRKEKTISRICPDQINPHVSVKYEKLQDVKKLLITHYGESWEDLPELQYYKMVFEKHSSQSLPGVVEESCETMD